jgi:eukaryotic-like serine/threonine-protein kinase
MNPPTEGDVLAGKFQIERVLGVGGMGMVVSALHLQLEERVAIKFLLPEALANEEAVARFGREARAAVKIKSEHVARVIDVGALESGAPYMVMELLRGQDLSQLLAAHGAMPFALAAEYVLQACEALAEAHAMGIVHRDLKPANLFVTARADGSACVKVLDFGISKVTVPSASGSDMGMTRTQTMMGSPLYMSPEQMASARDVDQRADIWAVGTVLYELVTGRPPFEAETMPQLCAQILNADPPPPRRVRADLPELLDQVIMRCLRKDRNQRYANVAALAADLAHFAPDAGPRSAERISRVLSASGISPGGVVPSRPQAPIAASNTGAAWGATQASRGGRAIWLGLASVVVAALIGVVVWKVTSAPLAPPPDVSAAATLNKPPTELPPPPAPSNLVAATSAARAASAAPNTVEPANSARTLSTKKTPRGAVSKPKPVADAKPKAATLDPLSERN